jgi:hypothetical protein
MRLNCHLSKETVPRDGDTTYTSAADLSQALRRAAAAHVQHSDPNGPSRPELAGLARRVPGARAGRQRVAAMNGSVVAIFIWCGASTEYLQLIALCEQWRRS